MGKVLYYVHDPMCSWCWAFNSVWQQVLAKLPDDIEVRYILGGLAPDSDEPMPEEMQKNISAHWHRIQQHVPGTQFNDDFWTVCQPRRSTYPSCRAIIAAKAQNMDAEKPMILAIQQAYYLQAKNPSNDDVLIECARQIGLDAVEFAACLNSPATHQQLLADIKFAKIIGANGFPSVVLEQAGEYSPLNYDYNNPQVLLGQLS